MTRQKLFSAPAIACAFVALALAALSLGPFMRETDQAWLLDGGMGIANGHSEIARAEFNFDKQFVSYYLPGVLFKFFPRPFTADTLVLAGNVLGLVMLWGSLFWLLAKSSRRLPLALALPLILAPTFLVYSAFYASAFTSVSFVIFLAAYLDRKAWRWPNQGVVFALAFCAVGARADAIFILPLLAMLHSSRRTFVSVLQSPNTWLMATGGLAAFFLGRALYLDHAIDYAATAFRLKIYLGYVAFGLGGATLLLLAALHAIGLVARKNRCKLWTVFLWLGLALPMGYYSLQLLTPRHCTVGAVSLLVFVCARRGRMIFHNYFRPKNVAWSLKTILLLTTLVPVFVGINLADINHPKITCTQPTLLPTGAGVAPTGAYLAFCYGVRQSDGFVDHNHAVWAAAKSTLYAADANGKVPYLFAPIESYLIFSIRLQNKIPDRYSLATEQCPPHFYMESRSLMRFQFTFPPEKVSLEKFLNHTAFTPASVANWHGITMLLGETNAVGVTNDLNAALWALNTAFQRDEFRLEPTESLQKIPADWAGKKLVVASRGASVLKGELVKSNTVLTNGVFGDWNRTDFYPLHGGETVTVQSSPTEKIFVGLSVFPEWMSLQKL